MPGPRKKTSKGLCRVTVAYTEKNEEGRPVHKTRWIERKTWGEADQAKREFLADLGKAPPLPSGTLAELFELTDRHVWAHLKGSGTRKNYNSYRRQIERGMGGRDVREITPPEITRYLKTYEGKVSTRTIKEHVVVLSSAFRYAVSDLGWRDDDPAKSARHPIGRATAKRPPLARDSFELILAHLPEAEALFCRIMADSAMREIEVFKATGADVVWRFDRYWIDVKESKTPNGIRLAPIATHLAVMLQAAGDPFAVFRSLKDPNARIWREWRKAFARANEERTEAGLAPIVYTYPYKMRAMRLTEWARSRMDRDILAVIAGHSHASVTDQFYVFLDGEDAAASLKSLGVTLGVGNPTDATAKTI